MGLDYGAPESKRESADIPDHSVADAWPKTDRLAGCKAGPYIFPYHEAPLSISTNGIGSFQAMLNPTGDQITYELQFSGLEGGNTLFAHVHIGQIGTTGGVMFFLCGGGGKPACPNGQGTVTGTVNAGDIIGPAGQGVAPGQFLEAISAMRAGSAYANVHTVTYVSGEIRGQINEEQF
jgi:CHRD domain